MKIILFECNAKIRQCFLDLLDAFAAEAIDVEYILFLLARKASDSADVGVGKCVQSARREIESLDASLQELGVELFFLLGFGRSGAFFRHNRCLYRFLLLEADDSLELADHNLYRALKCFLGSDSAVRFNHDAEAVEI